MSALLLSALGGGALGAFGSYSQGKAQQKLLSKRQYAQKVALLQQQKFNRINRMTYEIQQKAEAARVEADLAGNNLSTDSGTGRMQVIDAMYNRLRNEKMFAAQQKMEEDAMKAQIALTAQEQKTARAMTTINTLTGGLSGASNGSLLAKGLVSESK